MAGHGRAAVRKEASIEEILLSSDDGTEIRLAKHLTSLRGAGRREEIGVVFLACILQRA